MTGGTFPVTIAAPPEKVWPWIADLGKHAEWAPHDYSVEWIEGEPNAVGSRYRSVGWVPGDTHHENTGTITENSPPTRFALKADDKEGEFQTSYTLTPTADGTEVAFTIAFPPQMKGAAGLLAPIAFPLLGKPEIRKRMQLLKEKVEASA
jgi:uncharacterized protein YndB with AHSA1/START domain